MEHPPRSRLKQRSATPSRLRSLVVLALAGFAGAIIAKPADADPNARTVENIAAFARIFGCVRYFCPSDQAAGIDWNALAVIGVADTRNAPDDETLREGLRALFEPIAPGIRITGHVDDAPLEDAGNAPAGRGTRYTYWQHHGVRLSDQAKIYASRRVITGEKKKGERAALFPGAPPRDRPWVKEVAPRILLSLPLTLPVDSKGRTLPAGPPAALAALQDRLARVALDKPTIEDPDFRAAEVAISWNVFQHFHPYLDSVGVDWEEVLRSTLRRSLADRTSEDFYATLSEMVARLEDGHGYIFRQPPRTGGWPIRAAVVEERVVITGASTGSEFKKGDIIERIDGRDAMEVLRERERYVSGSPHLRQFRALNQFGEGPIDSVADVEIDRDGAPLRLAARRGEDQRGFFFTNVAEFEFPAFAEVGPGIFYVNTKKMTAAELAGRMPELAQARGVIFDERSDGTRALARPADMIRLHEHIIPHLIDEPIKASPMRTPRAMKPDREDWTWFESSWPVRPVAPRLAGRIVFINVPPIVSYGETCMAMIAGYRLATLVGEPTAGCNGNANFIELPDGLRIMWTGMEVLKHDRTPFYRIGFLPDFPVRRTIESVRSGQDEFLAKAIEVIESPAPGP
jgi:hypothetical protein